MKTEKNTFSNCNVCDCVVGCVYALHIYTVFLFAVEHSLDTKLTLILFKFFFASSLCRTKKVVIIVSLYRFGHKTAQLATFQWIAKNKAWNFITTFYCFVGILFSFWKLSTSKLFSSTFINRSAMNDKTGEYPFIISDVFAFHRRICVKQADLHSVRHVFENQTKYFSSFSVAHRNRFYFSPAFFSFSATLVWSNTFKRQMLAKKAVWFLSESSRRVCLRTSTWCVDGSRHLLCR